MLPNFGNKYLVTNQYVAMYDKVRFWLDRTAIVGDYSTIANYITKGITQTDIQTGETKLFGSLNGLKISMFCNGISIVGSLPKYLYGNNIYPLDRQSTIEAVSKISDELHTDISKADITGFEFGTVLLLSHSVPSYLARLGEMPKLVRVHFEAETLYYKSKSKQQPKMLALYDKIAEQKAKGCKLPVGFEGQNLLKYELRLNRHLPKQLKVEQVKASTLTDSNFYSMLVNLWQRDYFSINKQQQLKTNVMSKIKTVSDAFNVFVARLMATASKDDVAGFIDELKDNKVFADRKNYTRLKNKLVATASKAGVTETDELIRELDNVIKNTAAYY